MPHRSLRWGWVNVEDDLRSWGGPLQVSAHPNPQLVDVGVLSIVGRDGQRVGDGQELGEASKRVRSLPGTKKAKHLSGLPGTHKCSPLKNCLAPLPSPAAPEGLEKGFPQESEHSAVRGSSGSATPICMRGLFWFFFLFFFFSVFFSTHFHSSLISTGQVFSCFPSRALLPAHRGVILQPFRAWVGHGQAEEPGRELAQGREC